MTTPASLRIAAGTMAAMLGCTALPAAGLGEDSAVVLTYQRFGDDGEPGSIAWSTFDSHIAVLAEGGWNVEALPQVIATLQNGQALPERTVSITIDQPLSAIYDQVWPRLKAARLPFTLFVSTDPVDEQAPGYMTWGQIRALASAGVTIGSHGRRYRHMATRPAAANAADLGHVEERFLSELGARPLLFAYPYGEYNLELRGMLRERGFIAAFGQHSGAVAAESDMLALPRFVLTQAYGDIERFRLVIDTLPLPVSEVTPADPVLAANPPVFGFTVAPSVRNLDRLACFAAGLGPTRVERLGPQRIEVRFDSPLPEGRTRINCTMPGPEGRWRWFGVQYLVPALH